MTKTTRRATVGAAVVAAVLGSPSRAAAIKAATGTASGQSLMAPDSRVRGVSARIVAIINDVAAQSKTFRGLVDQIGTTDGIVYVAEGQCGHGVRACLLLTMTTMGPNRVLRILVDPRNVDADLMGSIGHELQHAVEVLSHQTIRTGSAMILLFNKEGAKYGRRFETDAAVKVGNAVRAELREGAAAGKRREQPLSSDR